MRNNKDKWSFYNTTSRQALSVEDVLYWKNTLKKILKIGLEFEFNLPEKKNGTCKGDSNTCPCSNLLLTNYCWQKCIYESSCELLKRTVANCENSTNTCEDSDCGKCRYFKAKCYGIFCNDFTSSCYICNKRIVNCEGCAFRFDPNKSPDAIRESLNNELRPVNSYGVVGQTGVHSITTDGSLLGKSGAEIITVGRRVDYWEFYKMAKNIINTATEKGAYMNERCSTHMHALASYYGKLVQEQERYGIPTRVNEMERDMPEIILANLHQLVRRYQNAMTWMMMGLDDPDRMTRWEKFRVSILPISPVLNPMREIQSEVSHNAGGNKYGWINYNQTEFSPNGDIRRFHVEFRGADGILSPSAAAAIACMYYALIIKAVEVSRYGLLEVGNKEWFEKAKIVKEALLNNVKGYQDGDRFSNTSKLHKHYDVLIGESLDLVRQLKAVLIDIGPAYEVLEKLAERPIALRRCDGQTYKQIEDDLGVVMNKEGKLNISLTEIITLNQVSECQDMEEWVKTVSNLLLEIKDNENITQEMYENPSFLEKEITGFVNRHREDGKLIWSNRIGAPIII